VQDCRLGICVLLRCPCTFGGCRLPPFLVLHSLDPLHSPLVPLTSLNPYHEIVTATPHTPPHPHLIPAPGSLDVEEACRGFLDLAKEGAAACVAVVFSDPAFADLFQRLYSRWAAGGGQAAHGWCRNAGWYVGSHGTRGE